MVKWIRVAAGMVFLAAFLWGCSPGQADEQTAEEQQQAVAGLEGRDVQRVTQTASPEPEGTGNCRESLRGRSFRAYSRTVRISEDRCRGGKLPGLYQVLSP